MLIKFTVENHLSFSKRAELSMYPSLVRKFSDQVIKSSDSSGIDILKTAVIYGANASGKSNLIKSIYNARSIIVSKTQSNKLLPFEPFKLNSSSDKKPTLFEFEIKNSGKCYAYGFSYTKKDIVEEWLFEIDKSKDKKIYERRFNNISINFKNINIKNKEKQFLEFTAKGTPSNRLFLTECYERSVLRELPQLESIRNTLDWFHEKLSIIFPKTKYLGLEFQIEREKDAKPITDFLKNYDTGIESLSLEEIDITDKTMDIPAHIMDEITSNLGSGERSMIAGSNNQRYMLENNEDNEIVIKRLMTARRDENNREVKFNIFEESDGTQRLLDLAPGLLESFTQEKVFIIDELNRSLHPDITKDIHSTFLKKSKGIESQMIFTTHEMELLSLDHIRRDEAWFTQKLSTGETDLYSLEEFKPRYDKDIREAYLKGRFGAKPNIKH